MGVSWEGHLHGIAVFWREGFDLDLRLAFADDFHTPVEAFF